METQLRTAHSPTLTATTLATVLGQNLSDSPFRSHWITTFRCAPCLGVPESLSPPTVRTLFLLLSTVCLSLVAPANKPSMVSVVVNRQDAAPGVTPYSTRSPMTFFRALPRA